MEESVLMAWQTWATSTFLHGAAEEVVVRRRRQVPRQELHQFPERALRI